MDFSEERINRRIYQLGRKYNLSYEDYYKLIQNQGFRCAICGTSKIISNNRFPHVDHCHKTGKVRGVLCPDCNLGLGMFKDSIENLKGAIEYLSDFNNKNLEEIEALEYEEEIFLANNGITKKELEQLIINN